mmetsp:Transcript_108118/g.150846  ORF Transcript_108118/g.150846 Transcript_108118/m.150846 type:complete len:90 (+) Transcript_108118:145-414(+)|eukprot:symbB.v1.2.005837.t1/scaffold343.1/size224757/14
MAGTMALNPAKKFPEFDGYAVFMNEQLEGTMDEDSLDPRLRAKWDAFTERQKRAYQERVPGGPVVRVRLTPTARFSAKRQRTELVSESA